MALRHVIDRREQALFRVNRVGLVEQGDARHLRGPDALEHILVFLGPACRLDHEQHEIGIGKRTDGRPVHQPVHRTAGVAVQAGRVDEDNLLVLAGTDGEYPVPRRLWLCGDDTHLPAQHRIDQRRFADVRPAHDGDETAAKLVFTHRPVPPSAWPACAARTAARRCVASGPPLQPAPRPARGSEPRTVAGAPCRLR